MSISDQVLKKLRQWMLAGGEVPAAISVIRVRDDSSVLDGTELILRADDPSEHETLRGMERIEGEAVVSISVDDVHDVDDRQWIIGEVTGILREGTGDPETRFEDWLADGEHGVLAYGFRVSGSTWEEDERRVVGRVAWGCWACATA